MVHVCVCTHVGETAQGPVVKQIMDKPRCAQLQIGDLIIEVNDEKVASFPHNEFVILLKRCPKGNQARFLVLRSKTHLNKQIG